MSDLETMWKKLKDKLRLLRRCRQMKTVSEELWALSEQSHLPMTTRYALRDFSTSIDIARAEKCGD